MSPEQLQLIKSTNFLLIIDIPERSLREGINEIRDIIQELLEEQKPPSKRRTKAGKPLSHKRPEKDRWKFKLINRQLEEAIKDRLAEVFARRHFRMVKLEGSVWERLKEKLEPYARRAAIKVEELMASEASKVDIRTKAGRDAFLRKLEGDESELHKKIKKIESSERVIMPREIEELIDGEGDVFVIERSKDPLHPAYTKGSHF